MKSYKPYTKSRRHMTTVTFKGKLTTNEPHKALTRGGKRDVGRAAGTHIELVARGQGYADLKMPSSEIRRVQETCWATLGEVSNDEHHLRTIGKAGRSRWLGIRPTVRGTAMNPVDHPHGGGEGRQGR